MVGWLIVSTDLLCSSFWGYLTTWRDTGYFYISALILTDINFELHVVTRNLSQNYVTFMFELFICYLHKHYTSIVLGLQVWKLRVFFCDSCFIVQCCLLLYWLRKALCGVLFQRTIIQQKVGFSASHLLIITLLLC